MARTLRLLLTALYVVLLASCSEGGPSEAQVNPDGSPPTPVEDVSDEVIDACNAFVADSQPFYKVSQGLFAPDSTVQMAVRALGESQSLSGDLPRDWSTSSGNRIEWKHRGGYAVGTAQHGGRSRGRRQDWQHLRVSL
jgi:hypothetical protein